MTRLIRGLDSEREERLTSDKEGKSKVAQVADLGQGSFLCQLSVNWDGYEFVLVITEIPIEGPKRTRIYASRSTGGIDVGGNSVVLKEFPGLLTCEEALTRSGYILG